MISEDPLDIVAAGYDRLAPRWDQWADTPQPPLRDRYVDWLEAHLEPRSKVLELGSGTGRPVAERLAHCHDYLGVDASTEMVAVTTRNVPSARFLAADMRRLELPTGEFDAVVAFYSIIHVPRIDQPALFPEIHRWLRSGGYLVTCLSSEDLPAGQEDDWLDAGPMFWNGYDGDTNRHLLTDTGFELIARPASCPRWRRAWRSAFYGSRLGSRPAVSRFELCTKSAHEAPLGCRL